MARRAGPDVGPASEASHGRGRPCPSPGGGGRPAANSPTRMSVLPWTRRGDRELRRASDGLGPAGRRCRDARRDPRGPALRAGRVSPACWSTCSWACCSASPASASTFEDANVAHALGFAALVLILAEGGLTTHWPEIRPVMQHGVALATLGVAVSVTVMALGAHYVFGLDWQLAILLGAVTSPTDAAAVFSVLRRVPLPRRLTGVLEAESGLNDAPTVLLVTLVSAGTALDHGVLGFVGIVLYELAFGVVGGLLVGFGGGWVMRRVALPSSGLYPIAVLSLTVLAYAGTRRPARVGVRRRLHGRARARQHRAPAPRRDPVVRRGGGLAGADRAVRDARPARLARPDRPGARRPIAVLAGLLLTLVARPLSVFACSFVGPDGPARAAVRLLGRPARRRTHRAGHHPARRRGAAVATELFDIVFVMVVIYTLLTGPTLPWVARVLRVAHAGASRATSTSRRRRWSGSRPTCSRSTSPGSPGCTASRSASCGCRSGPRCR